MVASYGNINSFNHLIYSIMKRLKKFNELFDMENFKNSSYNNKTIKTYTKNAVSDMNLYSNEPQAFINWLTHEFPYFMRASTLDKGTTQIFMFKNKRAFISVSFDIESTNNIIMTFVMIEFYTNNTQNDYQEFTDTKKLSEYIRKNIIASLVRNGFDDAKKLNPSSN